MAIERISSPFSPIPDTEVEVTVEAGDPIENMTADGGMLIDLMPMVNAPVLEHNSNLAEFMDEDEMDRLASELISDFEADRESRSDWEKAYIEGLDLLGLKFEERDTPWKGACGVFHPMLSEAVVRFQAQTIQEIFPASGPVKTKVVGDKSSERIQQASRVQNYLNYLTVEKMVEYRTETERLLFSLPIAGSAFRKMYFDQALGRPCSMFVPAEDFVVSYGTSDLSTCERATHIMKRSENWVRKQQVSGFYRDVELPTPAPDFSDIQRKYNKLTGTDESIDMDQRHVLLEMHVDVDLPGFEDENGVALPYVIAIDKSSGTILSIRRNWQEEDPNRNRRDHFVHYQYLPGLGFYGFGLVHMIGGLSKSATSLLRQLVDSGTLANLPGGLKTRGLRIKGDDTPIMPGEFRDVDVPAGSIRDNLSFLPYKEPSGVLYQLLGDIVQEGRRFASAADVKAADINGEAPVGTTLAVLEREMKVMSAVQARVHSAMGKELRILAELVKDFGPDKYPYEQAANVSLRQDFDDRIDIFPVSDPNAGTMAQRIMQYQAALQLSAQAPQMYDMPFLHRQMLEALGIQDADKVIPSEDEAQPTDPVSENMAILTGKPIKAFLYQDHEAHIQVHMAAMQNPKAQQMLEKNPKAKSIAAAMMDHVTEHMAMMYRSQIEKEVGVPLPKPGAPLPEDIELRLSRLVAPAAAQVTGKAAKQAQAEKNAEQMKDPIVQMQMRELKIKEEAQKAKQQEAEKKAEIEREKVTSRNQLDTEKMERDSQKEMAKLIADIVLKQMDLRVEEQKQGMEERKQNTKEAAEGFRLGLDAAGMIINAAQREEKENDNGGSE